MEVLILQVFVSLILVLGSVLLFAFSVRQRDHQHGGRLGLLPLEDDGGRSGPVTIKKPDSGSKRNQ